jgi:hypothetical protein
VGHRLGLGVVGHVSGQDEGLAAASIYLSLECLEALCPAGGEPYPGACRSERPGGALPDPRRRSRNHGGQAREWRAAYLREAPGLLLGISHVVLLLRFPWPTHPTLFTEVPRSTILGSPDAASCIAPPR